MRQRHLVDEGRALHHVRRCVNVRGVVHRGRDALRQHARLRVIMDAFDFDVFEIGPVRGLIAEPMREIGEFEPHTVVGVFFKHYATDFFRHGYSSPRVQFHHSLA